MEGIYHYCFSSPGEVICRDDEDFNRFVNCYALALYKVGGESLADVVMSNHFHAVLKCGDMVGFSLALRRMYVHYFNYKYGRRGELGEHRAFYSRLEGVRRICTAVSYVRSVFSKEMGYAIDVRLLERQGARHQGAKSFRRNVCKNMKSPDSYIVGDDGVYERACFTNIAQCEILYGSVRNFIFQMTRFSSEEWLKEQVADSPMLKPVTLADIEAPLLGCGSGEGGENTLNLFYRNEKVRYEKGLIQDMELCEIIDRFIVREFGKGSVYMITDEEKRKVIDYLRNNRDATNGKVFNLEQLKRCLVLV